MLQRMQALEQRAPLLHGNDPKGLNREQIHHLVARQLAGFDQRAQAQDLEIQRLRRQLEQEKAMREQLAREAAASSSAPQAPTPSQMHHSSQVPSSQDAQVRSSSRVRVLVQLLVRVAAATNRRDRAGLRSTGEFGLFYPQTPLLRPDLASRLRNATGATGARCTGARISNRRGRTRCLCTGVTGFRGRQVPHAQVSGAQASAAPGGAPAASATPCAAANPTMDALFAGMQQLQTMQAQGMRDKSVVSNAPEAVKPSATALPMLKAPDWRAPSGGGFAKNLGQWRWQAQTVIQPSRSYSS